MSPGAATGSSSASAQEEAPDRLFAIPSAVEGTDLEAPARPARTRLRVVVFGAAAGAVLLAAGLLWSVRDPAPTAVRQPPPSQLDTAFAAGLGSPAPPTPEPATPPAGGSVKSTSLVRSTPKSTPTGLPNPGKVDLALRRPVTASGSEGDPWSPANAVDGDPATRWSSAFADPQWISVDLGALRQLTSIKLTWENAYAIAYRVQVSVDGKAWKTVYSTTSGQGGVVTIPTDKVAGRQVRVVGTKRNTTYGYSLFELDVR